MPISNLSLWGNSNMAGQDSPQSNQGQNPFGGGVGSTASLSPLAQMVLQRSQNRMQNNPLMQANQQMSQMIPQAPTDMPPLQPPPAAGQMLQQQFPPVGQTGVNTLPPTPPKSLASAGSPNAMRQFDTGEAKAADVMGNMGAPGGFNPGASPTSQSFGGGIGGQAGMPNLPPNILQQALAQGMGGQGGNAPKPSGGQDVRQGLIAGLLSQFGF